MGLLPVVEPGAGVPICRMAACSWPFFQAVHSQPVTAPAGYRGGGRWPAAMSLSLIEGSTLARALYKLATSPSPGGLDPAPWEGTATELLEALRRTCRAGGLAAAELPAGERALGQKVREIAAALRRAGVDVRPGRRTGHRRSLIIQQIALTSAEDHTAASSLLQKEEN